MLVRNKTKHNIFCSKGKMKPNDVFDLEVDEIRRMAKSLAKVETSEDDQSDEE